MKTKECALLASFSELKIWDISENKVKCIPALLLTAFLIFPMFPIKKRCEYGSMHSMKVCTLSIHFPFQMMMDSDQTYWTKSSKENYAMLFKTKITKHTIAMVALVASFNRLHPTSLLKEIYISYYYIVDSFALSTCFYIQIFWREGSQLDSYDPNECQFPVTLITRGAIFSYPWNIPLCVQRGWKVVCATKLTGWHDLPWKLVS